MSFVKRKTDIAQSKLSLLTIFKIAKSNSDIFISKESISLIKKSRNYLEQKVKTNKKLIYGVNTGFGSLCSFPINESQIEELQTNLVNSHNAGVGDLVPEFITKLILLLKIRSLCFGYSGVRLEIIDRLITFYNNNSLPIIKEQGSLGASGDLAPLASVADMLISKSFNQKYALAPLKLSFKEGLALLNGTQFMSAYGLYCIVESRKIYHLSNLIASISLESFSCRKESFDPLVSKIRNHYGQKYTSKEILKILNSSKTFFSNDEYVQDPYSFRCIPQVHGASLDVINHVESIFQTEVDSVTDNPLVFSEEDIILSAGNFHGQPLAMAMDYLAIAISEIGSISERRIFKLISGERGLPLYLTSNPGLKSGSMITQYTAASIVSQNKQYCSPSSVDSIVSSNGQEDHVSMGANAATKLYKVIANTKTILSIELFNAIQAMHFKKSFENTSPIIKKLISNLKDEDCFPKLDKADDIPVRNEIDLISRFVSEFDVLSFLNISD